MRPPRLAYISADPGIAPDATKGASVHFRELGRALARAGLEVDAYVARPPCGRDGALEATVVPVEPIAGHGPLARELATLGAQERLARALAARGPHDAVYERLSLFCLAGLAHARGGGVPYLLEVNAPLWEEALRWRDLALAGPARAIAREALRGADRVLVVSRALRDVVLAEGVAPERVLVAPNGVDGAAFAAAAPAERPASLAGKTTLVFAGSLRVWHGVPFLLEALAAGVAAGRDLGLWVVGEGPLSAAVEEAARRLPGRIVVEGPVPHARVASILKAADVAVAPYPAEGPAYFSPLKIVEALAAGCPVLAADVPCVREALGDPPLGETYAPGDRASFLRALDRLIADPPAARARARHAAERVLAERTWDHRAAEVAALVAALRPARGEPCASPAGSERS